MAIERRLSAPSASALAVALAEIAAKCSGLLHLLRSEGSLREVAAAARFFVPEVEVIALSAWDPLP